MWRRPPALLPASSSVTFSYGPTSLARPLHGTASGRWGGQTSLTAVSHHSVAVCVLTPHSCGLLRAIAMSTGQCISPAFRAKTALMPQALCLLPHFSAQRAPPQSWSLIPVLLSPLGQPGALLTAPCVHRPWPACPHRSATRPLGPTDAFSRASSRSVPAPRPHQWLSLAD